MNEPLIVREVEWPHGVRCMDCGTPLTEGMPYSERLSGFKDDHPVLELICIACAVRATGTKGER